MRVRTRYCAAAVMLVVLNFLSACATHSVGAPFVTGLNQPRGLAFDANGDLLVAEAGALDTRADGTFVAPVNHSGRLVRINQNHELTTVATGLPLTDLGVHGQVGVTDVAVMSGAVYVLTGEGADVLSRSVLRVTAGGQFQPTASIRNFAAASLPSDLRESTLVAANPYAMVPAPDGSALYVADGASGRVLHVQTNGKITVFADVRTMSPLTGLTFGADGSLYFADFGFYPHTPGGGSIQAVDRTGALTTVAKNLTMPIDVGFDASGAMYVLQFGDGRQSDQPYRAASGQLLRIARDGGQTVILDRLDHPTAMLFSTTGDLYIALGGAFTARQQGLIMKIACRELDTAEACSDKIAP